jgi:hypothetical protein
MEQVTQGNKCDGGGMVLLAVMVEVGAEIHPEITNYRFPRTLAAKGAWGGASAHGGRARVRGARVSGGVNDPDVCGLWFQESLPLCMVITPSVLFSCLL